MENVPQLTAEQKLIVENLKANQEKELKAKRLEIEALKILKIKKSDRLDELKKCNSKTIANAEKITIPDRWVKLAQDIQTHPGKFLKTDHESICIIEDRLEGYFLAGLKAILLEKNAELKEMRETKAEIKNDLERGDAALAKVYQKMTEMKELHHFVTNNNHTESEEVPKPRATVSTIKYNKLMQCHNLTKEIAQLESELQTLAESKQGLIATFSDSNVLQMHTFLTNLKSKIAKESEKEQENINELLAEWDPNE